MRILAEEVASFRSYRSLGETVHSHGHFFCLAVGIGYLLLKLLIDRFSPTVELLYFLSVGIYHIFSIGILYIDGLREVVARCPSVVSHLTGLFVYTGRAIQEACPHGQSFAVEVVAALISFVTFIFFELLLVGDRGDLVLIVGEVDTNAPSELAVAHEVSIEFHFHTAVAHVTDVGIIAGEAIRAWQAVAREHVVSAAVEHFHLTAQATLEEREFNTHVEVTVFLPRNVLITQLAWHKCQATVAVLESISRGVEVIADTIITLFTIRRLELEFVHPLRLEEGFLREDPRTREAPEVAPAVIGMEARRSIATERS